MKKLLFIFVIGLMMACTGNVTISNTESKDSITTDSIATDSIEITDSTLIDTISTF